MKTSDKCDPAELIELIEVINPSNQPGKIMIIVRMGAELLREHLPRLISAVEASGKIVVWQSDPMHGNTIKSESGYKTRPFERIRDELRAFFDVHEEVRPSPLRESPLSDLRPDHDDRSRVLSCVLSLARCHRSLFTPLPPRLGLYPATPGVPLASAPSLSERGAYMYAHGRGGCCDRWARMPAACIWR